MSEKYKELLEQYDIKVLSTFRSRGTFQCETEQGLALLKEISWFPPEACSGIRMEGKACRSRLRRY